jgi:hypothetical protein
MFGNRHSLIERLQAMTTTLTKTPTPVGLPDGALNRILDEGYGPGAWYGSDLRAAVGDVASETAFKRPATGRHNIAEIAMHQAYWAAQIAAKLTGDEPAAFPLEGEDWFDLSNE